MSQENKILPETASQTAGPYVHIGLMPSVAGIGGFTEVTNNQHDTPAASPQNISVCGQIYDGNQEAVKDAVIELWHADQNGNYCLDKATNSFRGWGRTATDFNTGLYNFTTIKPGPVLEAPGIRQAPHICLWIVARGINMGLYTRMYFPEPDDLNSNDPVLLSVDETRRSTLVASRNEADASYVFDIHLQGSRETVFFDA